MSNSSQKQLLIIAPGAQEFFLPGGPIGILIIHGYGGSIGDYRLIAQELHQRGYSIQGMRLAGHGADHHYLRRFGIADWRQSIFMAGRDLRQQCQSVVVLGSSFGGALAVDYVSQSADGIAGLVLVNTPFEYRRSTTQKAFLRLLRIFTDFYPKYGISQAEKERYAKLGSTIAWPIDGLFETELFLKQYMVPALARISVPTLLMNNQNDPYVSADSTERILNLLGTPIKRQLSIPGHTHRPFRDPVATKFMAKEIDRFIKSAVAKKSY